jgi:hypothetical protein
LPKYDPCEVALMSETFSSWIFGPLVI